MTSSNHSIIIATDGTLGLAVPGSDVVVRTRVGGTTLGSTVTVTSSDVLIIIIIIIAALVIRLPAMSRRLGLSSLNSLPALRRLGDIDPCSGVAGLAPGLDDDKVVRDAGGLDVTALRAVVGNVDTVVGGEAGGADVDDIRGPGGDGGDPAGGLGGVGDCAGLAVRDVGWALGLGLAVSDGHGLDEAAGVGCGGGDSGGGGGADESRVDGVGV